MKHTYEVLGMSCDGCKTSIEDALLQLPAITKIVVDLTTKEVSIEMGTHIQLPVLQQALLDAGLHYTIQTPSDNVHQQCHHSIEEPPVQ